MDRIPSKFEEFTAEVSRTLTVAATSCYLFRSASYTLRLALAALAISQSGLLVSSGKRPICATLPSSYLECRNTTGDANDACWIRYPLFSATLTYYCLMALIAVLYLGVIEVWGWWWTLVSLRQELINHSKQHELLQKYRSGDDQHRLNAHNSSELAYSQECALRYAYYLYFKCDQMSVSWMLVNQRSWRDGPTKNQVVLPWPWIQAVYWLFGKDGFVGCVTERATWKPKLEGVWVYIDIPWVRCVALFLVVLLTQPVLVLIIILSPVLKLLGVMPCQDKRGVKPPTRCDDTTSSILGGKPSGNFISCQRPDQPGEPATAGGDSTSVEIKGCGGVGVVGGVGGNGDADA